MKRVAIDVAVGLLVGSILALIVLFATGRQVVLACEPTPVTADTPTGIKGCVVYGTGTASRWPGPGVARNDCVYPWLHCTPIRITSLQTGRSIVVTPTMFGDLYTGTPDERIVDLDPAAVEALGLNWEAGLYDVTVWPAADPILLPNTAMGAP